MDEFFSTKAASEITGASKQAVRLYTDVYAHWFSAGATPDPGRERRFIAADLRLIRYIYQATSNSNVTHQQVQARLNEGALDSFKWQVPQLSTEALTEPPGAGTAFVHVAQLEAAHSLLEDAQTRERQAVERVQAAQGRIAQLERELGKAKGELAALKAQWPSWARVFGGGE